MNLDWVYGLLQTMSAGQLLAKRIPVNEVTVLSLHRIANDEDFFWQPIPVKAFDGLLAFCAENFEVVSFSELWDEKRRFSKPPLVLSFDDGYKDFIDNALPLLIKYNLPCNHNIVTECADGSRVIWTQKMNIIFNHLRSNGKSSSLQIEGKTFTFSGAQTNWMQLYTEVYTTLLTVELNRDKILDEWAAAAGVTSLSVFPMMNWGDIKHCMKHRVEIGSHTRTHTVLALCNEAQLKTELEDSKKQIEQKLETVCETIAFPNGQHNVHTIQACVTAGYKNILLVNEERYKTGSSTASHKLIDRINAAGTSSSSLILRTVGFNKAVRSLFR